MRSERKDGLFLILEPLIFRPKLTADTRDCEGHGHIKDPSMVYTIYFVD